ncbi:MAG: prepilin-type N-terminal cleavage/methylation domain-containing protein [Proteobacteria bacterium]|nr:prepilin-type N-terminal cleavage/methylation domain-containing protein [Pseudomonadota bacterium]
MTKKLNPSRSAGFTLIEVIAALVVGLLVSTLLVELGFFLKHSPEALDMVDTQYETLREMERVTSQYRNELENGTLNLSSLLTNWSAESGVTLTKETVNVSATDGSFTFHGIHKVQITKSGQSMTAYFTE